MYLVFDIGGTNMRVGISPDGSDIKETKSIPTPQNFDEGLGALKQVAKELATGKKIVAAAGGIAGSLDNNKTMLVASPHIQDWVNKPLRNTLETILGTSVKLENDSLLGGLGEAVYGAGGNQEIVAYIAVGTGVGGARFVKGRIDENSLGFEPGHQIIINNGNACRCGGKGHLEAYIGGKYLEEKYQKSSVDIHDPQIWDDVAKYLSIGLTNAIVLWSPNIVVIGGSVANKIPLDKTQVYLNNNLTIFPNKPTLTKASLAYPGLFGALELLKN
jgi:glucokinase